MSFYGTSFSINGKSCEDFGLMLYDFNTSTQGESRFAPVAIEEDRIPKRYRSFIYGLNHEETLEITLIFGADEISAASGEPIDRQEMAVVSAWLRGDGGPQWVTIEQPDMEGVRYRGIVTELEMLEFGFSKWAYQATLRCDSPYAYSLPMTYSFELNGDTEASLRNHSTVYLPHYPKVTLNLSGDSFAFVNHSDGDYTFTLTGLPTASGTITIDGETGVMECEGGLNLYPYCNFKFPRFVRGINQLTLTGNGTCAFQCEWPMDIGG